jgi:hypothetical protein
MISLLILAVIICLVVAVLFYVVDLLVTPLNINRIIKAALVLIGLLVFLQKAGWLGGLG